MNRSGFTRWAGLIWATVLLLGLAACTVGPVQLSLRETNSGNADSLPLTVTAVLATNTQIAQLRTATAVSRAPVIVTVAPAQQQPPAQQPPAQPTAEPVAAGDIRLVYNDTTLTLYNISGHVEDIGGLSFHSDGGTLVITQWDNGFLSASLYAFPAGDCLMAWPVSTAQQPKPPDCGTRHSWLGINIQQDFWRTAGTFEVRWYGQPIAACTGTQGTCDIALP